jgi:hypothetical protein
MLTMLEVERFVELCSGEKPAAQHWRRAADLAKEEALELAEIHCNVVVTCRGYVIAVAQLCGEETILTPLTLPAELVALLHPYGLSGPTLDARPQAGYPQAIGVGNGALEFVLADGKRWPAEEIERAHRELEENGETPTMRNVLQHLQRRGPMANAARDFVETKWRSPEDDDSMPF